MTGVGRNPPRAGGGTTSTSILMYYCMEYTFRIMSFFRTVFFVKKFQCTSMYIEMYIYIYIYIYILLYMI